MDPALVAAGRFETAIEVPLPDAEKRIQLINHYLAQRPSFNQKKPSPHLVAQVAKILACKPAAAVKGAIEMSIKRCIQAHLNTVIHHPSSPPQPQPQASYVWIIIKRFFPSKVSMSTPQDVPPLNISPDDVLKEIIKAYTVKPAQT